MISTNPLKAGPISKILAKMILILLMMKTALYPLQHRLQA